MHLHISYHILVYIIYRICARISLLLIIITSSEGLEQGDAGTDLRALGAHGDHVVGDVVEHLSAGLDAGEHLRQLLADHGLFDQRLAEDLRPWKDPRAAFERFFMVRS